MYLLEHCPKTLINFIFLYIFFVLIFERVLPQSLRAIAKVIMYVVSIDFPFLFGQGWQQQVETTLGILACAVHGTADQNNSLANIYRHAISVSTNDWDIYGRATGRANNGDIGDIGAGHEVCIRTLSIVTRAPSHLSLVLGILLLTIAAVLIQVMVVLILLARILGLVLALVVVAVLF